MKLFDPPCRNTEICPTWKSCLECEWRVCVSSTDAVVDINFDDFFTFSAVTNTRINKYKLYK